MAAWVARILFYNTRFPGFPARKAKVLTGKLEIKIFAPFVLFCGIKINNQHRPYYFYSVVARCKPAPSFPPRRNQNERTHVRRHENNRRSRGHETLSGSIQNAEAEPLIFAHHR
jgi:hypothetical protein